MPTKQKTRKPAKSEILEEEYTHIRVYSIGREVDTSTKDFERCLKNLKTQFGFHLEKETIPEKDL